MFETISSKNARTWDTTKLGITIALGEARGLGKLFKLKQMAIELEKKLAAPTDDTISYIEKIQTKHKLSVVQDFLAEFEDE